MHGHVFGVSKQVELVYKCASLEEATSINFFVLSGWSTACILTVTIFRKYMEFCLKSFEESRNFAPKTYEKT